MTRTQAHELGVLTWLTAVWVLLWGSLSWANVITGVGVAVAIRVLLPLPTVRTEGRVHLPTLVRLVVVVSWDLVVSSVQVLVLVLRPGPLGMDVSNAVVRSHLRVRSNLVLALLADVITLVPGSMVLDIDQRARVITTHVLDVRSDADIERFQRKVTQLEDLFIGAFEALVVAVEVDPDDTPAEREETR
ncbi:MAG: Na+/H+ antiporter subunit E [Mycobacteriaceae bacterium]